MKAKKIYYSIVVGLQSLLILLLLVNVGYCLVTSDLTMFPTTALYLNFYPFINFCQTHNPYDLLVFISLMILILVMHFATIYILFKKVKKANSEYKNYKTDYDQSKKSLSNEWVTDKFCKFIYCTINRIKIFSSNIKCITC